MIEAGTLFQRFTRTVRDLSRQTGKRIRFLVAGGETPLDRVVYDGLFEPLLHIIRNAVAHGFESVEDRVRQGKPEIGTIRLSARREGNTILIEVRDDGRGIDLDSVRIASELRDSELRDLDSLAVELTKKISPYRAYPDPAGYSYFQGGLPSGVRIFAMTFEEAPVRMVSSGNRPDRRVPLSVTFNAIWIFRVPPCRTIWHIWRAPTSSYKTGMGAVYGVPPNTP